MHHAAMRLLAVCAFVVLIIGPSAGAAPSTGVVLSQVYGGGGNSGATLKNDYIELFNRGTTTADLTGWSVQYASSGGTSWQRTNLTAVTLQPGEYYLVQEAAGAGGTTSLPTPDATGNIAMAAGAGKVALVSSQTSISSGTSCPTTGVVDFAGYGSTTNCFEGTGPTGTLSNTTAALRANSGCTDTDQNATDFATGTPAPRNTSSPTHDCTAPTGVGSTSSAPAGRSALLTVTVEPGFSPASTGIAVACDLSAVGGSATQSFVDDGTNGDVTGGDLVFSDSVTIPAGTSPGNTTLPCIVSDEQGRSSSATIALTVEGPLEPIHAIQGASHTSPLADQVVSTNGIVTATATNGFWLQDPSPDADDATSEGVFVFTSSDPTVTAGDAVHVNARVQEFRPGGAASANLTTTELASPTVTVVSSGNPLPPATVVGTGGRIPPNIVIEDDASSGDVETSGVFDPQNDGLDFWESLEGMRVQLNDAVAVGPTNAFGETQIVGDDGANASLRTARGGLLARPNDFNPERVVVDDQLTSMPAMNVGDHYTASIIGVLDYNFGNFFVHATQSVGATHDGVTPETTAPQGTDELAVGTFNVENLAPSDPPSKFDRLAGLIVHNLQAPDILSVEEVQDNSGSTNDGVVAADQTLTKLVTAISAANGPTYEWREIDPVNDQDGGQPGGNIRQVFLFRTDRGVSFVDREGGTSTNADDVLGSGSSTRLAYSPGRIDPTSEAWTSSRKPLAGEFMFEGHHLFVIANHFNSKGGDDPLEGHRQPPIQVTAAQRHQQAQEVHDFVAKILTADPSADVVVDGDLNDFEFSETVSILKGGVLTDLIDTLPLNERYSYVFEGNSQTLDHVLLSESLKTRPFAFDVVHVNAEFADQASDHDPSVVRLPFYTFTSLCTLVRSYATDPSVADGLCAKLADAAAASGKKRSNTLDAFRNQVRAQTGKTFTADEVAILLQLVGELPA